MAAVIKMKTLVKILIIGVMSVLLMMAAKAEGVKEGWEPISAKHKNLFVLKTEKNLVGAKVEVFYQNGEVIAEQKLLKRKMVIDFNDVKIGTYTIRITKGSEVREFQYSKQ